MMTRFIPNYPQPPILLPLTERLMVHPDFRGRDVCMAFIDAGFAMHPDLGRRVLAHIDASTEDIREEPYVTALSPASWHGQMTSVIAAGNGQRSNGRYRGLASGAEVVLIKVSTPRMEVKERDILRGLRWIASHHWRFRIRVVNISLGGDHVNSDPDLPLHRAIRELTEQGIVVVISAGNWGEDYLVPPASSPDALVIGGYNDNNTVESKGWTGYNNNYGRAYDGSFKPDLIGPAQWIASPIMLDTDIEREARWLAPLLEDDSGEALSHLKIAGRGELSLPDEIWGDEMNLHSALLARIHSHKLINAHYQHVDGTSVSAPIVASVIAQMLEANPHLTPHEIRRLLITTASYVDCIDLVRQGAGAIHPLRAVEAALAYRS